jgi:hypothetical protein
MNGQASEKRANQVGSEEVERLAAHVRCLLGGQVRDLHLVLRGPGLILQGQARTYYAKQLAQHAVMRATTCTLLANDIEVC